MRVLLTGWLMAMLMISGAGAGPLKVVCTTTDLGWLAAEVGGDLVEIVVLCPGERDPHFLPAKPSLARKLGKADLLCYNGLELEVGWLPVLLEKARNPRVRPGQLGDLDCAGALEQVLEVPVGEVSRAQGDVHPEGNPHYLLDPRNGLLVAGLMAERLAVMQPDQAESFFLRAGLLAADLEPRIKEWHDQAEILRDRPLVVYTKQWEYLADWLGLELLGSVEHRPGIAPSPRHVDELVGQAEQAGVRELVAAPWNHLDVAEKAADRMNVALVVLPAAVDSREGVATYSALFDIILADLRAAVEQ